MGNPKSGLVATTQPPSGARPPSIQHLKKLVNGPQRQSLRYSLLPAPPMTELEFWAALVSDYPQTAQRLPTLTSKKIRGGVPPPLRGVVWPSIAGARDSTLHEEFQRLCGETSPYEALIGKDVGRSFPNVEMFRQKGGEGQLAHEHPRPPPNCHRPACLHHPLRHAPPTSGRDSMTAG